MAGLPEKMIEYVLETRIDAQSDELALDIFLEDFILTHIIYMPSNALCNYLKNYYTRRGTMVIFLHLITYQIFSRATFDINCT